ncbi:Protein kinase domain-containing protein [Mycena indigotica]|uniref:Protein kinase domain-containing protein n=1 Tax=Mycena indigotica TaxID=2126181 RepID=A0A8H6SGT1_9AGAR|nr:Protein kinase domain-containing protein [Mycena indigotica]KAF7299211.1 Protein kinase domain-containing protein [Mycena indigotica]
MSPTKPPLDIVEGIINEVYLSCSSFLVDTRHYCSLSTPCPAALEEIAPFVNLRLVSSTWNASVTKIQHSIRGKFFTDVEAGVYYPHAWHINTRVRKSVLLGRYRVFQTISAEEGSRGVYLAYDLADGCSNSSEVVLKCWVSEADFELHQETAAYQMLEGCPGIPQPLHLSCHDPHSDVNILALPKLGPSLEEFIRVLPKQRMDRRMVLTVAVQMLRRYREIHERGVIHIGMKPGNICLPPKHSRDAKDMLYIIDFGFSFPLAENLPLPSARRTDTVGNRRFMSVFAHHGISQSQRDDLESLAYLLSYLYHGELPWDRPGTSHSNHQPQMWRLKTATTATELFSGMDTCFVDFWRDVKGLAYGEVPDYDGLVGRFETCFVQECSQPGNHQETTCDWWNIWEQSQL